MANLHCDLRAGQRAKSVGYWVNARQKKKDLDLVMPFHIVKLQGGCQCFRKVEQMLRMIPALGSKFPLPLKKTQHRQSHS
jgi:hypothetical protein